MYSTRIILFVALLPICVFGQTECKLSFSGKVFDAVSKEPLPFANLYLKEIDKGTTTNDNGRFTITSLCRGAYLLECSYVGYKTITYRLELNKSTSQNFYLQPDVTTMNEVMVTARKEDDKNLVSQVKNEIKGEDLIKVRGAALGEALASVPGVYTLQSGPSIFKPVIHGLHSNRILIFNNGVRQEGQQWGSEHAPEIDPFIGTKLSVVKGASSVRYGSDAIGGVILVEPASMPLQHKLSGEVNTVFASNNGMGVASGILQDALDGKLKGLSWRLQGTYRRAGNSQAPRYYMENTGFEEANFSSALSYKRKSFGVEVFYSQFNTRLGIFTGTHAESVSDIQAAIERPEPITPSYFTYTIDRPYQQVKHELFKANTFFIFKNDTRLDVVFARQQNERSEYDYLPLNGALNPELYLRLVSHTADVHYKHKAIRHFTGTVGLNGITQGNVREYQMLIPNFRNYGAGLFYMGKWTNDRLTLEGGARYDYRWLRAYTVDNNTAQVVTPTWSFNNVSGTLGSQYFIRPNLSWAVNIGTAWRAPTVNELLSQGVHQSAVAYEIGNPNLHSETAYNFNTSLNYQRARWNAEIGLYENIIDGYIFLKPDLKYIRTVRGAYPTFTYTQVDALFRGVDLTLSFKVMDSLTLSSKSSLIYAWNRTINDYLQLIPSNRFESTIRYGFGNAGPFKQVYFNFTDLYVSKQNSVPANSDYAAPPAGYMLISAGLGFSIPYGKHLLNVSFTASNLLNTTYRDYMDRFRYFTDEPGRNFTLRVRIPFG